MQVEDLEAVPPAGGPLREEPRVLAAPALAEPHGQVDVPLAQDGVARQGGVAVAALAQGHVVSDRHVGIAESAGQLAREVELTRPRRPLVHLLQEHHVGGEDSSGWRRSARAELPVHSDRAMDVEAGDPDAHVRGDSIHPDREGFGSDRLQDSRATAAACTTAAMRTASLTCSPVRPPSSTTFSCDCHAGLAAVDRGDREAEQLEIGLASSAAARCAACAGARAACRRRLPTMATEAVVDVVHAHEHGGGAGVLDYGVPATWRPEHRPPCSCGLRDAMAQAAAAPRALGLARAALQDGLKVQPDVLRGFRQGASDFSRAIMSAPPSACGSPFSQLQGHSSSLCRASSTRRTSARCGPRRDRSTLAQRTTPMGIHDEGGRAGRRRPPCGASTRRRSSRFVSASIGKGRARSSSWSLRHARWTSVGIGAGPQYLSVTIARIAVAASELGDLGGADEGEIHRPEEKDLPPSLKVSWVISWNS